MSPDGGGQRRIRHGATSRPCLRRDRSGRPPGACRESDLRNAEVPGATGQLNGRRTVARESRAWTNPKNDIPATNGYRQPHCQERPHRSQRKPVGSSEPQDLTSVGASAVASSIVCRKRFAILWRHVGRPPPLELERVARYRRAPRANHAQTQDEPRGSAGVGSGALCPRFFVSVNRFRTYEPYRVK